MALSPGPAVAGPHGDAGAAVAHACRRTRVTGRRAPWRGPSAEALDGDVAVDLAAAVAAQPRYPHHRHDRDDGGRHEPQQDLHASEGRGRAGVRTGQALRRADPLLGPVVEDLVLPDRHLGLQRVDQGARGGEGVAAVGRGGGDDDGEVADPQLADPVHGRDAADVVLARPPAGRRPRAGPAPSGARSSRAP